MLFHHAPAAVSYTLDEDNLVSAAGLVPVMRLAQAAGLVDLAQKTRTVAIDKGANAGAKVSSLVAGMSAGADSIDDMDLLRHGHEKHLSTGVRAQPWARSSDSSPSVTSGSSTRSPRASWLFWATEHHCFRSKALLAVRAWCSSISTNTVIEVHSAAKQGAGFGYSGTRGLNALLVTASTSQAAPLIIGQRLRKGAVHSARGAGKLLSDALCTVKKIPGQNAPVVVRADSAYYSSKLAQQF